jgi:hypothetical protein
MDNSVNSSHLITKNKNFVNYQKCLSTNSSCDCDKFLNDGIKQEVTKMNQMAKYYYTIITPEATNQKVAAKVPQVTKYIKK